MPHRLMGERKVSTTVYITEQQNLMLKQLSDMTKVPVAEYIRQGIDIILKQHHNRLPGQLSFLEEDAPDSQTTAEKK